MSLLFNIKYLNANIVRLASFKKLDNIRYHGNSAARQTVYVQISIEYLAMF